ncbi:MAG: hypothetical protein AAF441_10390 [Pseudomonadota bacterium]
MPAFAGMTTRELNERPEKDLQKPRTRPSQSKAPDEKKPAERDFVAERLMPNPPNLPAPNVTGIRAALGDLISVLAFVETETFKRSPDVVLKHLDILIGRD